MELARRTLPTASNHDRLDMTIEANDSSIEAASTGRSAPIVTKMQPLRCYRVATSAIITAVGKIYAVRMRQQVAWSLKANTTP